MSSSGNWAAMDNIKLASSYICTSLHEAVELRLGKQGLAAMKPRTLPQYFREFVEKYESRPALRFERSANTEQQQQNEWQTLTYKEYLQHVERTAVMLLHVGLQPRSSVAILSVNCPEWFFSELAALFAGGVAVGIYPSSSVEAVFHVLDTSEATICVVDNMEQMAKVRQTKQRLPRLRAVIQINGPFEAFVGVEAGYYRWHELEALNFSDDLQEELARRERNVVANECAVLVYTSGTVGMPKAVMWSHDAAVYCIEGLTVVLNNHSPFVDDERIVSFLPLSHIAGQLFDIFLTFRNGGCVYFADRNALKSTLGQTLRLARPTRFFAVPRVFEKLQEQFAAMSSKSFGISRYILDKAREAMLRHHLDSMKGKSSSNLKYWLSAKVVHQVKSAFGLDECRTLMIGAAPSSPDMKHFYLGIDLPFVECFGSSETGVTNMNSELKSFDTVGKPLEGIEEEIHSPDENGHGEIWVRGRSCFMGYLYDLEKTKEAINDDGWFHTGDIGCINTAGELVVSGRIKELIITAGGENIPPVHIENLIKSELSGISNVVLVGDQRKYLTVLMSIKTEVDADTGYPSDSLSSKAIEWMQSLELDFTRLSQVLNIPENIRDLDASTIAVQPHPKVLASIEEGIQRANKFAISNAHRVQKFKILPHDLSLPTGELGNTLKLRRNIILQKYANVIEQMYK